MDCEQDGHFGTWSNPSPQLLQNISNSPLFQQSWFDAPSPSYVFNYNGKYQFTINDLQSVSHPQNNRAYLYWNQAMSKMHSQMLQQSIVKATKEVWNIDNVCNYMGFHVRDWDTAYDQNGHPFVYSAIVGNAQSHDLNASFLNASLLDSGIYKILDSDPTLIVRTDAVGFGSGQTINASVVDAWFQMLILIQKIRSVHRSAPNIPIRPFISSRNLTSTPAFPNPKWASDPSGFKLYNELLRHVCLTGVEMIHYWNTSDDTVSKLQQSLVNMNAVLTDVNDRLGGWTLQVLATNRISFKADYIISGAVTADGMYLWRVTPKPGVTLIDENAQNLVVDSDGGAWITNSVPDVPVFTV